MKTLLAAAVAVVIFAPSVAMAGKIAQRAGRAPW